MRVLTPFGYKTVAKLSEGDAVVAFDPTTGHEVVNSIEGIERISRKDYRRGCQRPNARFDFYTINDRWTLFQDQSIWANGNVTHVGKLKVGDVVYDEAGNDIPVTSVKRSPLRSHWFRFEVGDNHCYTVDGLLLHNANRFLITGGGSVSYTAINTAIWSTTTGGGTGASVPGSSDAVIMDGASGGGTVTLNFGGTITIQSWTWGAFTGTIDNSVNNNNVTMSATAAFSGSGAGTRTFNAGSTTYTCTATTGSTVVTLATTTGLTWNASTSTFDLSGAIASGTQTFSGGGLTFATVKISGARLNAYTAITNSAGTIGTLNIAAAATISITAATTVTTLAASAAATFIIGGTLTITNAFTLTGSASAPFCFLSTDPRAAAPTIACAAGSTMTYAKIQDITFTGSPTATNSDDLGHNSGIAITAPSAGVTSNIAALGRGLH